MYIGADEAGKGPVLGPMIAAAVRADPDRLPDGIDDSKRLTADRREELAARLRSDSAIAVGLGAVEPAEIDDPTTDMNTLTVAVQARAIADVLASVDRSERENEPIRLVVDAGDVSEERFARRLEGAVEERLHEEPGGEHLHEGSGSSDPIPAIEIRARHGADEDDPVVGSASILAKVERDRRVAAIDAAHPDRGTVGSGYPSDPDTRAFLETYVAETGDVPACARRTWATCKRVLAEREQSGLSEFSG
ncbi:ribonuclease HII [Halopenitus sp. H-Gu1]|uniref:ribonuclease HII n=1 Tax=Halopenitus sp. H-Gu1 TaxID=3242697 RepID=UPI00359D0581